MASDLEEGPCFTSAWSFPGLYCTQRVTHTPLLVISRDEELTPTQGSHFYFKTAVIVGKYALRGVKKMRCESLRFIMSMIIIVPVIVIVLPSSRRQDGSFEARVSGPTSSARHWLDTPPHSNPLPVSRTCVTFHCEIVNSWKRDLFLTVTLLNITQIQKAI